MRVALIVVPLLAALAALAAGADFYEKLGLKRGASEREIKKAYRQLTRQFHPDKNPNQSEEDRNKFVEIQRVYEVLSDPDLKPIYDTHGEEGIKEHTQRKEAQQAQANNPLFNLFTGGAASNKGRDVHVDIQVPLEMAFRGGEVPFSMERDEVCESCRGTGAKSHSDIHKCPSCGGSGHMLVNRQIMPGFVQRMQMPCDKCGGQGSVIKHKCPVCRGHKIVKHEVTFNLPVDRGTLDGAQYRFEGEADQTPGIDAGDLVANIIVKSQPTDPRRNGRNLYIRQILSLKEALLGFDRTVHVIADHSVRLARTGVTQDGFVDVLEGEGFPELHESGHGHLYVEYKVVLPEAVSPDLRRALSGGHDEL